MNPHDPFERVFTRGLGRDERAVSTTVSYALNLSVAAILMTTLLVAGAGFVDDQRERAVRTELRVLGAQLAEGVSTADRLANAPGTESVVITRTLPWKVAGRTYTIEIYGSPDPHIELSTTSPDITVGANLTLLSDNTGATRSPLGPAEKSVSGGSVRIVYGTTVDGCGRANELVICDE